MVAGRPVAAFGSGTDMSHVIGSTSPLAPGPGALLELSGHWRRPAGPRRAPRVQTGPGSPGSGAAGRVRPPLADAPLCGPGPNVVGTGHLGGAQHGTMRGQVNLAHAPPMVS